MKSSSSPDKVGSPDKIPDTTTLVDSPPCTESTATVSLEQNSVATVSLEQNSAATVSLEQNSAATVSAEQDSTSVSSKQDSTPVTAEQDSTPVGAEQDSTSISAEQDSTSVSAEQEVSDTTKSAKGFLWSSFFPSSFSVFETQSDTSQSGKDSAAVKSTYGWATTMRRIVSGGSMRGLRERLIGPSNTGVSSSTSEIWFLGVCYKISPEDLSGDSAHSNGLVEFVDDFSSRIWMTYRKGFSAIGDSRLTTDDHWGCMHRSSQMLVAQALLFHHLGRSWRKPLEKPYDQVYIQMLDQFGDSESSAFSIHNLIQAGRAYGLAAGSWVGPYAMCRSWETLARLNREHADPEMDHKSLPMAVYIVSGDEDGERGGAPVLCIEDAARHCSDFRKGQADWSPLLLLVPLVLGLEKVNTRYIPSLRTTFTFPQSLGILGGKPGASTYLVGVQDDKAFYLDPHEVQQVAELGRENLEADTTSYHCSVVRNLPLDMIDPSLAIGFYCRDKDDFDDFCARASKLAEESGGAPLFTITESRSLPREVQNRDVSVEHGLQREDGDNLEMEIMSDLEDHSQGDEWQLL
ncbi:hypothetical protein MKW94_018042 [Papaver nudicaule]|uniref:Cysteine protease n=1 Tax=Papaver nudicaule TaxID=74823 RepID=A0AA41RZT0_PAPNU|nr:hypothetical protein [Papaver nudicaule]